ncbi:hypothetical protein BBJ28_00022983 [Nothophytophthora sp. Chile5]|nr:hypothetical protein BBJ28_00022983 [Nothophytophthora sp. Chile5]
MAGPKRDPSDRGLDPVTGSASSSNSNSGGPGLSRLPSAVPPAPRLNVGVFSKRKGVRYHRDGQVRSCRFCEILRARAEHFLYEDEHVVVFRPLRPIVPSHILIVPRVHIRNVNRLAARHRALLTRMHRVAEAHMAADLTADPHPEASASSSFNDEAKDESKNEPHDDHSQVRYSFHVPPFNSIDHVHMHAFRDDPQSLGYLGRIKYRTESWWCRSYEQVVARLDELIPEGVVDIGEECLPADEASSSVSLEHSAGRQTA